MRITALPRALIILLLCALATPTLAEDNTITELNIGSYNCPPFAMLNEDKSYSGLSILLWEKIALEMNVRYTITNHGLTELLNSIEDGSLNVGVTCLSITPEREEVLDFSHSFYETHLAIAVKQQGYLSSIKNVFLNTKLLLVIAVVFVLAACVGIIYYLLEHRINDKLYSMPGKKAQMLEGFILGLLFITKGPFNYFEFKTLPGRVLTVFLAIFTTFFIASVTAVLASSFTLGLLSSEVKSFNDLTNMSVGAKRASTSSHYLVSQAIVHRTYPDIEHLLQALDNEDIDAIVADDAVLKYLIKKSKEKGEFEQLMVLPYRFEKQNYGLAIENNSPYREQINRALLKIRHSQEWQQALHEYFAEN
ncbi:transporter substrate-binding domain-containing protein [Vibrio sp. 404]|uniref:Transporter substrate-binding domain-containing protein n=1 Tax=Vibrio marinisediminis TaxID=2758441 RepID=A0A7W2FPD3_9VIBR|nr:transporter substrate-binding domain-containing protein [Vibrio marinisediminis]MBA5761788.1 transporter substrate-binding domain-containing protein [Vibrio marinisediminis]